MQLARVALMNAIRGLTPGAAEQASGPEKWSPREMVLHLLNWDREVARVLEEALRGTMPASLPATRDEINRFNQEGVSRLRHMAWPEALRELDQAREDLRDALESIPDEPAEVWGKKHPVGQIVRVLAGHDRHHAEALKRWRAERGV